MQGMLRYTFLALAAMLALAGCTIPGTPAPQPTPALPTGQQITIETPAPGASVGSPIALRGSISIAPVEGNLTYRLFDSTGNQLATGPFAVAGAAGRPARYETQIAYPTTAGGPGRIEVVDLNSADGSLRGIASVAVILQPAGTAATVVQPPPTRPAEPTPLPPTAPPVPATPVPQAITIDTPPPGTIVGSPVVLTGRSAVFPPSGLLGYRVFDAGQQQIGAGNLNINGAVGKPGAFNAALTFDEPRNGGPIRIEIVDQNAAGGIAASAALNLQVAPPQSIVIARPPSGTLVGSPAVIGGRLARLPFQSNLAYRVFDAANRPIGQGIIPVSGAPGQPTNFNASLPFTQPVDGGPIRVELYDQNGQTGLTVATSAIDLTTAPLQQQITIASPPPGTSVGSPVVITGRTARYPFQGKLGYRFTDRYGAQLSTGAFNVNGVPGQGASFNVSLDFNLPPAGGPIRLELFDQNAGTGVIVANTALDMYVQPPQPARQEISIDTPPPGTLVGSPVVITGRTTLYPFEARLSYRVRGPGGQVLGEGGITVNGAPGQSTTFVASIDFRTPPGADTITIEIFEPSQATGGMRAIATIDLRIAPQPR